MSQARAFFVLAAAPQTPDRPRSGNLFRITGPSSAIFPWPHSPHHHEALITSSLAAGNICLAHMSSQVAHRFHSMSPSMNP